MKKKKYLLLLAMSACVLSLAACGKDADTQKTDTKVVEENAATPAEETSSEEAGTDTSSKVQESPYADNAYAKQALAFTGALQSKNYEEILGMLALDSPDFVTVDDVERGLYSTGVKDLIGAVGDITVTDVAEDYKQASVVVTLGENSYTIPVVEQEDGGYAISADGICISDFTITAPRGVAVTLSGKELTDYLTTSAGDVSTYVIPQVGTGDKEAMLSCEGFDSYTTTVTPTSGGCTLNLEITDEATVKAIYADYTALMNNLFADALGNVSVETIKPYFCSSATGDEIQAVVDLLTDKDGFSGRVSDTNTAPMLTYVDGWSVNSSEGVTNSDVRVLNGETGVIRMNLSVTKSFSIKYGYDEQASLNLLIGADVVYEDGEMKLAPVYTANESCTDVYNKWYTMTSFNEW
jgi:hypothetical protein